MHQRFAALVVLVTSSVGAFAFQPVEAGLQPLKARVAAIDKDIEVLNQRLRAEDAAPEIRAAAFRQYQTLTAEREGLARQIKQSRELAQSPLVMYATPQGQVLPREVAEADGK
ncbi:hypothetical protein CDN99_11550 [Roseateles aquatilis]|uniref:Uncharacterized protein n=1 Tax=Roseateles aquatilis TaxID=431061 RepID=A0A246JE66_9BURK|nr:hypothetical protein [Roseateles aquatilis]OWQ90797.1 hypothetical protein CDN99_11550 [Roseateles aquatilis]